MSAPGFSTWTPYRPLSAPGAPGAPGAPAAPATGTPYQSGSNTSEQNWNIVHPGQPYEEYPGANKDLADWKASLGPKDMSLPQSPAPPGQEWWKPTGGEWQLRPAYKPPDFSDKTPAQAPGFLTFPKGGGDPRWNPGTPAPGQPGKTGGYVPGDMWNGRPLTIQDFIMGGGTPGTPAPIQSIPPPGAPPSAPDPSNQVQFGGTGLPNFGGAQPTAAPTGYQGPGTYSSLQSNAQPRRRNSASQLPRFW